MKCNIITAFVCLLVISLALTLCLSGCSSKNDSSAPSIAKDGTIELTSVDPSAVNNTGDLSFAAKTIAFQREFPVTALMLYVGSRPFVYGFDVINDSCFLMEVDLEGNILRDYDLSFLSPGESIAPINSNISELWVVVSGENESRTATYQKYGTLSEEGIFEEKFNYTSENDVVLNNIYITEDCLFMQRFYSSDNSYTFAVCTLDGQLIDEMKIPYSFIYKVDGKEVYISQENLFIADTSGCTVSYLDMENKELIKICSFDTGFLMAVKDGNIYVGDSTCVFQYNIDDGITEPLFTWSGINLSSGGLLPLGENQFVSQRDGEIRLIYPSEGDNRQTIVLAAGSRSSEYADAVMAFNNSDPDYKVVVKDYSVYTNGNDILNTELVSGKGPDIIDLTAFSDDISRSGVLEDLVPYFQNDTEYSLDDMLEVPLSAIMDNGKLTSFIPLFTVRTLICPEQYLPDGGFQGILDFEEKIGDVQAAFDGRLSREVFLRLAFSGDFANSYSAEDIESILRIAKQLPEGNEPRDSETGFPLFSMINVGGVPSLRYLRISLNNNIAIAGLPFCKDNTGIIIPLVEFGMNSQSEAKLGVWRFFKSFLSPNIYEGMAGNAFSLTKAGYEYALQSDQKAIADGMQLSMNINGKNEIIQITDTQDHSYCDQLLSAIHGVYHQNGRVYKLVSDSAAKYFNGDASVEATAEIILSKLSVYEAERS